MKILEMVNMMRVNMMADPHNHCGGIAATV
jgi:hypothetical protein